MVRDIVAAITSMTGRINAGATAVHAASDLPGRNLEPNWTVGSFGNQSAKAISRSTAGAG
ncbi:hypothetical protein [Streptomyces sp. 3211]|uniref:hypothetical protein n=1 Tax=Streptomyces sp. 3211 TaxID=1964449 RepID=UPI00133187D6|nr:hypothetical protein [Streptomyces sp. 3211]